MKYQLQCFDTGGCQAGFSRRQLRDVLGDTIMEKLDTLQQQDEIRRAGLDGLEDCPFCEFQAICPPVEENREFRCYNPECEMVSCRLCNQESHLPKTCQEAKRERGVSERHLVEEAMSEAFIRPCPGCKLKIVKEVGCNKMTCPKCYCMMCYVCKKDITREGYEHFGRRQGACRVEDDPQQEHMHQEVDRAQRAAIDKIQAEKPDISREDLLVNRPGQERTPRQPPRRFVGRDDIPPMRYGVQDVYRHEMQQMPPPIFPGERLPYPFGEENMNYGQVPLPGGNIAMPPLGNYPNINVNINVPYGGPAPMVMHNGRLARPPAYAGVGHRPAPAAPARPAARNYPNNAGPYPQRMGPRPANNHTPRARAPRVAREPAPNRRAIGARVEIPPPGQTPRVTLANHHQNQPPVIDLTEPAAHDYLPREVRR